MPLASGLVHRLLRILARGLPAAVLLTGGVCPGQQSLLQPLGLAPPAKEMSWRQSGDLAEAGWLFGGATVPRFVQRVSGTATLIADGSEGGVDVTEYSTSASFIASDPQSSSATTITVTPAFSVVRLTGPEELALPGELYRTGATLGWTRRANDQVSYRVGLSPSVASDFATSDHAFRMMGHALFAYQWSPSVQYLVGAAYLARNDIGLLPMAGILWTPRDDLRVELTAPRPRIARQIHAGTTDGVVSNDWMYVAGELGGGTWGVERTPSITDELTVRDFRLVFGYESNVPQRVNVRAEMGYVFGRKFEYASDGYEYEPAQSLLMRAGFSF
jgi:hypothetical protein